MSCHREVISVEIPDGARAEKAYIVEVIFRQILGVPFTLEASEDSKYRVCYENAHIEFPDVFLSSVGYQQRSASALPSVPLENWCPLGDYRDRLVDSRIPVLYGLPGSHMRDAHTVCNVDIFGSCFFMLSRYEEVVSLERDAHDRFPAAASLAWKADFLNRPIVDEYVEVLWAMMKLRWPNLRRRKGVGTTFVTCDVDQPFSPDVSSTRRFLRAFCGDIVRRRSIRIAGKRGLRFTLHRLNRHHLDENFTFDWYMKRCEAHRHRAAFFFIPDHTAGNLDGSYTLRDGRILRLIRSLSDRGHEIGVHGSYGSFRDMPQIRRERELMMSACARAGASVRIEGSRQHYLRWDASITPDNLDAAGYKYDTTGGYADAPGFRYGTAHPFPMWSWKKRGHLKLKQRPLILMEGSVLSPQYLGIRDINQCRTLMLNLKDSATRFGGEFTFLWHNSYLAKPQYRELFEDLVRA